ncbi:hypothetical protein DMUE_0471 [Dictyocoela muelleri]|nr:hypothetical protein DMUE_0471 [Dictyocoela muelleri]
MSEKSEYKKNILATFCNHDFLHKLQELKNAAFLINSILNLEKNDLSTSQQIDVLENVKKKLINTSLKIKYKDLLKKNPDLRFFYYLNFITCSKNNKKYAFVPLTTVDIERSFSKMNRILDDQRRSLSIKNLGMLLALNFNKR